MKPIRALGVVGLTLAITLIGWRAHAASEQQINAIIKSLAPIAGQTITKGYSGKGVEVTIEGRTIIVDYGYSVDLEVYFPFDSAKLTRRARAQLAALGHALSSPRLRPYRYLIAGHTDAKGADAYNVALSYRRAHAVKRYLISAFPIVPSRLLVIGWGESRLRDPIHPYAAVNRRVEVSLIAPYPSVSSVPDGRTRVTVPAESDEDATTIDRSKKSIVPPTEKRETLPPCSELVDPRKPGADLDDFKAKPGVNCQPESTTQKKVLSPGEKKKIQW